MPDVIEFNCPRVDMAFFREDSRRREIPRPLLGEIAKGAKRLDEQIGEIEQDTMIKYPPAIVLPCALYDVDNHTVIDAHFALGQRDENIFLRVQFAAPTLYSLIKLALLPDVRQALYSVSMLGI